MVNENNEVVGVVCAKILGDNEIKGIFANTDDVFNLMDNIDTK